MMFVVSCTVCANILGRPVTSEYHVRDDAEGFVRRHHALVGHRAVINEEVEA
ncbi:hypothetical protein I5I01_gp64 [Mycobacterium phage MooMoo]|uniref:Uncharacterized protein n=1 Tax=Mycobacterium phage MooMoo TaxID=2108127 RepID=A0A2P1JR93_9CAUD|nr:hypothetical protein I5I01_gp64 [Mycobacterium phage MooMoo]AVO21669.1 hypothetical protein SEA_MOOMOO_64 [Mycobacterium phage MooMoo]